MVSASELLSRYDDRFEGEQVPIGSLVGRTIEVLQVKFLRSSYGEGEFAVIQYKTPADSSLRVTTSGARNIVGPLRELKRYGLLPCKVKVAETDFDTKSGRKMLRLAPADEGVEDGEKKDDIPF